MSDEEDDRLLGDLSVPVLSDEEDVDDDSLLNLSSNSQFIPCNASSSSLLTSTPKIYRKKETLTPRKGISRRQLLGGPSYKCSVCKRSLQTERGFRKHQANHRLEESASKGRTKEVLRAESVKSACNIANDMVGATVAYNEAGGRFSDFAGKMKSKAFPEPTGEFIRFAHSMIRPLGSVLAAGSTTRAILPASLKSKVREVLHKCLCSDVQREDWCLSVCEVAGVDNKDFAKFYLQEFCLRFANATVTFIIQLMRSSPNNRYKEEVQKFSAEDYNQLFCQQTLHKVVGYCVRAIIKKARQYKNCKKWQDFRNVLLERFATVGTAESNPQQQNYWTELLARKSYTFVNDQGLEFFIEVAKIICYTESSAGTLSKSAVVGSVLSSSSLVAMWDELVGNGLVESESIYLMKALVTSLCNTFSVGII